MESFSFKLGEVEGPLDVILQLITKHKLNIYDIEISALVQQYQLYIEELTAENMEVASEFLEMAARLVHMKSVSLLPVHKDDLEKLKDELTGQLLEYSACKEAARLLLLRNVGGATFVREPLEIEYDKTYLENHNIRELFDSYNAAMGRGKRKMPPPASSFSALVTRRMVSVSSRIIFVLKRLYRSPQLAFSELFGESRDRSELVATFLAVLELVKAKRISVSEDASQVKFLGRIKEANSENFH